MYVFFQAVGHDTLFYRSFNFSKQFCSFVSVFRTLAQL